VRKFAGNNQRKLFRAWAVFGLVVLWTGDSVAIQTAEPDSVTVVPEQVNKRLQAPRSRLGRPFDAPIYLSVYGSIGGGFKFEHGKPGYGGALVFRPGCAANFLDFLYDLNTAMVLQADYQKVAERERILSGDLVLRHYLRDVRDPATDRTPFVGVGIGGSEILLPVADGGGTEKYWSWLLEAGAERTLDRKYLFFVKVQFRRYSHGAYDYSTWSASIGAGIPVPW